jgi:stage V sporulation protein AE
MIYLYSFLFAGVVCLISELLMDNTKLTPGHVTALFVSIGAFLDIFGIYDYFIEIFGGGALVPITSFGHSLIHGALEKALTNGPMGLAMGMFSLTSVGIIAAIIIPTIILVPPFFLKDISDDISAVHIP